MEDIHERIRSNIERAGGRIKDQFDVYAQKRKFQVGELV